MGPRNAIVVFTDAERDTPFGTRAYGYISAIASVSATSGPDKELKELL